MNANRLPTNVGLLYLLLDQKAVDNWFCYVQDVREPVKDRQSMANIASLTDLCSQCFMTIMTLSLLQEGTEAVTANVIPIVRTKTKPLCFTGATRQNRCREFLT